jgi:lipopolysaccharide export LptBFGC system permease protein LptF
MLIKEFVLTILGVIVAILIISWVSMGNSFFLYKVFAPKTEEVRRETFEQTKSYRDGMVQELYAMQKDYIMGDIKQKEALKSLIIHRSSGIKQENLPIDLQAFINDLKKEY